MFDFDTPAEDVESIRAWFADWGACVAAGDFEGARPFFDGGAIGFGTWMDMVDGLDRLEAQQWRSIWPNIRDFHHDTDTLRVGVSPDRRMAVGMLIWTSTGFHADGADYERPGRTTAVLVREAAGAPWRAIHTHVSLFRGVPQQSHGQPR
ncbi:MAG: YybH family protein [Alphaproteobacteria bacterium]